MENIKLFATSYWLMSSSSLSRWKKWSSLLAVCILLCRAFFRVEISETWNQAVSQYDGSIRTKDGTAASDEATIDKIHTDSPTTWLFASNASQIEIASGQVRQRSGSAASHRKDHTTRQTKAAQKKPTTQSKSKKRIDKKPLLLLHVGPHKTATSAIQCQLTYHRELLFQKASILYAGRTYSVCLAPDSASQKAPMNPRHIVSCLDGIHKHGIACNQDSEVWKAVDKLFEQLSSKDKNAMVILSDEAFARIKIPKTTVDSIANQSDNIESSLPHRTLHELLSRHYHVRVIVGYRRYHEWVSSSYFHYVKGKLSRGRMPTNDKYWHALKRGFSSDYSYFKTTHPTEYLVKLYASSGFDDIVVFDLHDQQQEEKKHLMKSFFQQTLVKDETRYTRSGMKDVLKEMKSYVSDNPNIGLPWEEIQIRLLALGGQKWNLVGSLRGKKKKSKKKYEDAFDEDPELRRIAKAVAQKVKASKLPPLDCLSPQDEEEFLERSLAMERRLFANGIGAMPNGVAVHIPRYDDEVMAERDAQHRASFALARHCSVDLEAMQTNRTWLEFFDTL